MPCCTDVWRFRMDGYTLVCFCWEISVSVDEDIEASIVSDVELAL